MARSLHVLPPNRHAPSPTRIHVSLPPPTTSRQSTLAVPIYHPQFRPRPLPFPSPCPNPQALREEARLAALRNEAAGNAAALAEQLRDLNEKLKREQFERERLEQRAAELQRSALAAQTATAPALRADAVPSAADAEAAEAQRQKVAALERQLAEAQKAAAAAAAGQAALEAKLTEAKQATEAAAAAAAAVQAAQEGSVEAAARAAAEKEEEGGAVGFIGALGIVVGGGLAGYVAVLNQNKQVRARFEWEGKGRKGQETTFESGVQIVLLGALQLWAPGFTPQHHS